MGSLGSNRGHHWAVIWATSSPLAISLTLSWWFGNGRWCSDELAVNFTTDHSFAIMLRVFFSSLFVWILQLCASWNVLCNSGLSYFTWTPWSLTENTLKSRKKTFVKKKSTVFSWFLLAILFPGRSAEAQKVSQLDFWALRHTAHGAVSPLPATPGGLRIIKINLINV